MAEPLQVTSTTWTRDSHCLFDYESDETVVEKFEVHSNTLGVRDKRGTGARGQAGTAGGVRMVPLASTKASAQAHHLLSMRRDGSDFVLERASGSRARDVWLVARDLPAHHRYLSPGSVFRLGRFEFEVRKLVISAQDDRQDLALFRADTCVPCLDFAEAPSKVCRICLMDGEDDKDADPLVAPCKCSGSVEHVHLGCLQHWVQMKFAVPSDGGNTYKQVTPTCELCKEPFPSQVKVGDQERPLLEIPSVEPPYIVLESRRQRATQHNALQTPQTLYVVSLATGKALSVGRSHSCDVAVDDVSLSRVHASVHFDDGSFVLEDKDSKFGTLLAFSEYRITPGATASVQSGCTLLSLSLASPMEPPELLEGTSSTSDSLASNGDTRTRCPSTFGGRSHGDDGALSAAGGRLPQSEAAGGSSRFRDCLPWRSCITLTR